MLEDCIKQKNVKLALEIRKEISKLTGLYAAQKIDVSIVEYKAKFPGIDKK